MRLPSTPLSKIKNVLHATQAALIVLAIILTIGVFATHGSTDGRTGWYFGLCFLCIPILIYLTMVPAWSRARKFSNIYAFAALDSFGVVAWLSAWAAVANFVVSGKGHGTKEGGGGGCDNFKYGSETKCRLSEATIFFGVLIMLLFVGTALISFKAIMDYNRTGILPGAVNANAESHMGGIKPTGSVRGDHVGREDEEAFDTNVNLRQDWEVEEYDHDDYHDRYAAGAGLHPGGPVTRGYSPARGDDHGDDDVDDPSRHLRPAGSRMNAGNNNQMGYPPPSHLDPFSDAHDVNAHRSASTSPRPLAGDTAYHSPSYGQGTNMYGR